MVDEEMLASTYAIRPGSVIGLLTARNLVGRVRSQRWAFECRCGSLVERFACALRDTIRRGNVPHCGCAKDVPASRRFPKEYEVWQGMNARCRPTKRYTKSREHYYGRGIRVHLRWRHSFDAFIADMGPRPSDRHSIERIDNDGHYEPTNCCWALPRDQAINTRRQFISREMVAQMRWALGCGASLPHSPRLAVDPEMREESANE